MPLIPTITAVLARTPEWLRQDLASQDPGARTRAEEALAATIAAALGGGSDPPERADQKEASAAPA